MRRITKLIQFNAYYGVGCGNLKPAQIFRINIAVRRVCAFAENVSQKHSETVVGVGVQKSFNAAFNVFYNGFRLVLTHAARVERVRAVVREFGKGQKGVKVARVKLGVAPSRRGIKCVFVGQNFEHLTVKPAVFKPRAHRFRVVLPVIARNGHVIFPAVTEDITRAAVIGNRSRNGACGNCVIFHGVADEVERGFEIELIARAGYGNY